MTLHMRTGIIGGRDHIIYGINCQDSLTAKTFDYQNSVYHIGVIADGCGEGKRSETGAHLATSFLIHQIEKLIKEKVSVLEVPSKLFENLLQFLKTILTGYDMNDNPLEEVDFIKDHLLFTIIGFVIGPKDTIIFAMGDGVVVLNDLIDIRNQQNTPTYLSYHLVDSRYLKKDRTSLPKEFDIYSVPTKDLQKLVVASDSWENELGILLSLFNENSDKHLQRLMNLLSQKEKRFKDDASIIVVVKKD